MNLAQHAIRRPVTVMMGVLIVIVLGIISLTQIPVDLYPPIELPTVSVSTNYSGVGPEEMENLVTKPIEQAVATIAGVQSVRSVSREGSSQVTVEFAYGTNMDEVINEVQQKVERAKRSLPDDADAPVVTQFNPDNSPILTTALASKGMGADQLRTFVDEQIVPYLERVDGVASVTVSGGLEREIKILVDPNKLEQYGLSVSDITQQLRNQNLDSPGGTVTEGGITYTVRTLGKFMSVDDIRKVAIPLKSSGHIFLQDVAVVEEGYKDVSIENKLNGQNSVILSIMKQSGTNTVSVVDHVNSELAKMKSTLPANVSIVNISDQSQFIRDSINTLAHDTLIGGGLAILIIWLFLRSTRNTLTISTAIPISVVATFALMYFADMSINTMSLGGLTLGIGMIVDDAIVVLENIHRHRENGLPLQQAAVEGTKEVAMPVIAATLTTVAVFFPIVFVKGITAQLFRDLAVTVSFSLLASLIVSFTVTPTLSARWTSRRSKQTGVAGGEKPDDGEPVGNEVTGGEAGDRTVKPNARLHRWSERYRNLLRWSLSHRKTVVVIAVASLAAAIGLVPFIGSEFIPASDQGQVTVSLSLPNGTELEQTRKVMTEAETILSRIPEVKTIVSSLGSSGAFRSNNASSSAGSFLLMLTDRSNRQRSTAEVADEIRQRLNRFPGVRVRVSEARGTASLPGLGGQGGAGGSAPLSYALRGNDKDMLTQLAERLTNEISQVNGVREADNTLDETRPEIQVSLDRERAVELGVTQSMVSSTIQTALRDQVATRFETGGDEIDVSVILTNGHAANMEDIKNLLLTTPKGEKVQIKDVANVAIASGPQSVQRYNQARVVNVTASLAPGRDLGSVAKEINKIIATFPLPPGYVIEQQGENQQLQESTNSLILAFLMAVLLVYMILAAQFESLIHPLSIMMSVPLSFFGASFSLWVTGRPFSVPAYIGIILLAGIVVRNAIVLVDFANILRRRGVDRTEALVTAASIRLRPILMTTLCTVLGLTPLALGLGEGGESQAPLATVVIGGLTVSTLLTLVVIPVVYSILDDLAARLKAAVRMLPPFRNISAAE